MPISKTPQESPQQVASQADLYKGNNPEQLKAVEAYERLLICEDCDKYIKLARICSECKCFMPLKARFKAVTCPLGKW